PKLFRNELLKNFCESITLADILIAGSLVNKGDDAYGGEAVLEDRGALRQADKALVENTLLLRVDQDCAKVGEDGRLIPIGRVAPVRRNEANRRICARD